MDMRVTFPGGRRVDASFGPFTVQTDQSVEGGGEGAFPEPFAYFLSSLATCAGIYVLVFCQRRSIPTDDLEVVQTATFDEKTHRLTKVAIQIRVPDGFPEKYRAAVARAAASCAIKKVLDSPPELTVETVAR